MNAEFRRIAEDAQARVIAMDLVQDLLDLVIPLSLSGIVEVNQGLVGVCGTVTSVMAIGRLLQKQVGGK